MPSIESYPLLLAAVAACEDKKAEDIRILALDPSESGLSDYFVICNGTNTRQNVAITDEVEIRLKREFGVYPNSVEGRRDGEWVLMDYVDFILHVFSPEKREYYGLERLRKSATTVSPDELSEELKQHVRAARGRPVKVSAKRASALRSSADGPDASEDAPATAKRTRKTVTPVPKGLVPLAAAAESELLGKAPRGKKASASTTRSKPKKMSRTPTTGRKSSAKTSAGTKASLDEG